MPNASPALGVDQVDGAFETVFDDVVQEEAAGIEFLLLGHANNGHRFEVEDRVKRLFLVHGSDWERRGYGNMIALWMRGSKGALFNPWPPFLGV